ncbi:MAG TPA: DUF1287 domain-containing protein [Fimbriimonas sp.]|nr:DUF1287 domain-containing protein [Fimbriimonas sp.]
MLELPSIRLVALFVLLVGCAQETAKPTNKILTGAKLQLARPAIYTPGYFRIPFPGGDLPADKGVCTDVVVRALRHAGIDLQQRIHDDMKRRFGTYPRRESQPDKNIDHRRVPNQIHWLKKFAAAEPLDRDWQPGDLVYWKLPSGLDHCGVVSDTRGASRSPLVIHNIWQTAEEDVLTKWKIVGHFRLNFRK